MIKIIDVTQLNAEFQSKWISVEDALPTLNKNVLVFGMVKVLQYLDHNSLYPYSAQRKSVYTSIDDGLQPFEWVTDMGYAIREVKYWTPYSMPKEYIKR